MARAAMTAGSEDREILDLALDVLKLALKLRDFLFKLAPVLLRQGRPW